MTGFQSNYGTVAQDEVTINMRSNRLAVESEFKLPGPFTKIKLQADKSDYQHTEFEATNSGTVFKKRGYNWRIEAQQAAWKNVTGLIGVQGVTSNFSADGEEVFAPYSNSKNTAIFTLQQTQFSWGNGSLGARIESNQERSLGNPLESRFTPNVRKFITSSIATQWNYYLSPEWTITGTASRNQRAPTSVELYANGPHLATNAYELGNDQLQAETSRNGELNAQWKSGPNKVKLAAYQTNFKNYILLLSDSTIQASLNLPQYSYNQVRATFTGFEASGVWQIYKAQSSLVAQWRVDQVKATDANSQTPLPRIAPLRLGTTLVWTRGPLSAQVGADHYAKPRDGTTDQYNLFSSAVAYQTKWGSSDLLISMHIENLSNQLAYSASSILTTSVPGKVPLPGRSVKVNLQASF